MWDGCTGARAGTVPDRGPWVNRVCVQQAMRHHERRAPAPPERPIEFRRRRVAVPTYEAQPVIGAMLSAAFNESAAS